jgi:acetyl/propionyl-CoA carboxylase alpha subunit
VKDYEARVAGSPVTPAEGWHVEWTDAGQGIARLVDPDRRRRILVVVEGEGTDWFVTLRGRRIPVSVRTWRERLLAEADAAAPAVRGEVIIAATLPGLVVAIAVDVGQEVEAGETVMTIEAMKMQNEVRAPAAGRVVELGVEPGATVRAGSVLARLAPAGVASSPG